MNLLKLKIKFLFFLQKVEAEYQFVVDIQSIENRGGRCADEQACNSGEGCCESTTCAITTCQYSLHSCKISSTSTLLYNERYSTDDSTCRSPKIFTSGIFERSTDSGITTSYFYKDLVSLLVLKVLNHATRTLPSLPYTNLKKSRTAKNWLLSMPSRGSLQEKQCSVVNAEK